jgi:hypothetical protein
MTAVARTRNVPASFRFDPIDQLLDKGTKIRIESTANFKRFNNVEPPLSKFIFAHIALGLAQ